MQIRHICLFFCVLCHGIDNIFAAHCEPIRIEICKGIGYNETSMPNLVGHDMQTDVDFTLRTFSPLINYGCSAQLNFFLCSAYLPMCTTKVNSVIGPCRSLCESVRARCHPVLSSFGFPWPNSLDCNLFPKDNNHENMCMEGPGESSTISVLPNKVQPLQSTCKYLYKSHLYVRLNRNNRCTPLCEAEILFDINEKQIAWLWIGSWSIATLLISIIALLCLILSDSKRDKNLLPLVVSHCLIGVSWVIRILAGRNNTSCGYDMQFPGISLLLSDGLSTSPCSCTFLLRYYFGMSALIWTAVLCYRWNLYLRSYVKETTNNKLMHNTFLQICAYGIPAIQTIISLVMRLVDADELLGTCYVGNQSDKALLALIAIPMLIYWTIGCGYLLSGYLTLKSLSNVQLPAHLNGLGSFLFIYNTLTALVLLSNFYVFGNRENWINLTDNIQQNHQSKAPLWLYISHPFLELLTGVLASAWAIGPKLRVGFCQATKIKQPMYKAPTSVQSQHNPYHSTSYQTICPQNTVVSNSSMVSMNILSKSSLSRKHPPYTINPHSHGRRSRSSYRTPPVHTTNLTSNETIL